MGHNPIPPRSLVSRSTVAELERWHRAVDDAVLAGMDHDDAVELADRPSERERHAHVPWQTRSVNYFQLFGEDPYFRQMAAALTSPLGSPKDAPPPPPVTLPPAYRP